MGTKKCFNRNLFPYHFYTLCILFSSFFFGLRVEYILSRDIGIIIYYHLFQFIHSFESRHWKLRASKELRELEKSICIQERKSCTFSKKTLKRIIVFIRKAPTS